ncbi:hypothetical protein D3C84_730310 [compost metagenome]
MAQLRLQRLSRDADIEQRLPESRQFAQCLANLALFAGRADQLIERQVTLEFLQANQLIQAFTQGAMAFEQLLLVGGLHQEELAGGLIAGDSRNGLRFVGQLLRRADPLADVVFSLELHQAAGTKSDQQCQQYRRAQIPQ